MFASNHTPEVERSGPTRHQKDLVWKILGASGTIAVATASLWIANNWRVDLGNLEDLAVGATVRYGAAVANGADELEKMGIVGVPRDMGRGKLWFIDPDSPGEWSIGLKSGKREWIVIGGASGTNKSWLQVKRVKEVGIGGYLVDQLGEFEGK